MNMKLTKGLLGLGAMLLASQVNAGIISITPSPTDVIVNDAFSLTVQGSDFATGMSDAGVQLTWNNDEMRLDSTLAEIILSRNNNGLTNFFGGDELVIDAITNVGTLTITANAAFGSPVGVGGTTFDMFSLNFTALPPPGQTSLAIGLAGFGNIINGDGVAEDPMTFAPGIVNVAPVPVPAAVWLFGSGLIGLVGIARRKTQLA